MASTTTTLADRLEQIEDAEHAKADPFRVAWDAATLVGEIDGADYSCPSALSLAVAYQALRVAERCQAKLDESGTPYAADNGETPADQIRGVLYRITDRVIRRREPK